MLRVCKKGFVQSLFQFVSYKGNVHVKPGLEGVDAFSTSCAGENNWLVPPVHLNSRTILHLEVSKEGGALLFAKWPFGSLLAYSFPNTRLSVRYVLEIIDPTGVFALRDYILFFLHLGFDLRFSSCGTTPLCNGLDPFERVFSLSEEFYSDAKNVHTWFTKLPRYTLTGFEVRQRWLSDLHESFRRFNWHIYRGFLSRRGCVLVFLLLSFHSALGEGAQGCYKFRQGRCTVHEVVVNSGMGEVAKSLLGSLSNHDDDGNKNLTNLHIWQWKTVFLHALHVHFLSFDILKTFSFFLRREMTFFAVVWTTWAYDDKCSMLSSYVPSAGCSLIPG